jgi:hypothetical protein
MSEKAEPELSGQQMLHRYQSASVHACLFQLSLVIAAVGATTAFTRH